MKCLFLCLSLMLLTLGRAGAVDRMVNLKEMVSLSGTIVSGKVVEVSEGRHPNNRMNATYVTIEVREALKGKLPHRYTFMQFSSPVVTLHLPAFREGEEVVVFLYTPSKRFGFTSPVGGLQGKFKVHTDKRTKKRTVLNGLNNANLFWKMSWAGIPLSAQERTIAQVSRGAIDYEVFVSLVKKLGKALAAQRERVRKGGKKR